MELNVTDLRQRLLDVIRRVETAGEEVIVVRHGRRVARIVPVAVAPASLLGVDRDRVTIRDDDDELLETGERWDLA